VLAGVGLCGRVTPVTAAQLAVTLGPGWSGQLAEDHLQVLVDEAIQKCMKEQGFDYVPPGNLPRSDDTFLSPKEHMETYGFGISTLTYSQSSVGPTLVGTPGDGLAHLDSKAEALADLAMDDAQKAAYAEALLGGIGAGSPGCETSATSEVYGEAYASQVDFLNLFQDQLLSLSAAVDGSQEVIDSTELVNKCLRRPWLGFSGRNGRDDSRRHG
jgi:hypothetical protein